MVYHIRPELDHVFTALADPTRRAIIARLATGETSTSELAAPFAMSLPAVAKHIAILERAGLVRRRRIGRVRWCRLEARPMHEAARFLEPYRRFWEERLDRLAEFLAESPPMEENPWAPDSPPPASPSLSRERSRRHGSASGKRGRTPKR